MNKYMEEAIRQSNMSTCLRRRVGAVIVKNNRIISKASNEKYRYKDVTAHAEIVAIRKACKKLKTTYLNDCELYVTLEPCMMCTSAIVQSHINNVYYCIKSPKYGYLTKIEDKNIRYKQIYNEEYESLIKNFFKNKR